MATMNVSVPDQMRDWVQLQVENGKYASASDYVRDLIRRDQTEAERWLASLDAGIERAMEDSAAGRTHALDDVRRELTARYAPAAHEHEGR